MTDSEWGLCKDCKWFQVEPGAKVADSTMGLCIEESLQYLRLRVSGNSGLHEFMAGEVAYAKGSKRRAARRRRPVASWHARCISCRR